MHKKGVPQPATRPKLLHIFTHRAQLQLTLGHLDHVFQQHGAGHRAYTAWYRGDKRAFVLNTFKIDIAAKLAVFVSIHSDVNHNCAVFNHIGSYKFRFTDSGNKDICTFGNFFKVNSF